MLPTREGRLMRTLRVAVILTFIATVGSAGTAWSWGDAGHKIICEIAFQELSESDITIAATVGYCVRVDNRRVYEVNNEVFDVGETEKIVTVDSTYLPAHAPTVADSLKRAGVRLAIS